MPGLNVPILGAGSVLSCELDAVGSPGVFTALDNALSLGDIGNEGSFVQTTPISKTTHEFIAGMKTPQAITLTFNDISGDTDQEAFLALADAGAIVQMEITFSSNRKAVFSLVLSGWKMAEPTHDGQLTLAVSAQTSGDVVWSIV